MAPEFFSILVLIGFAVIPFIGLVVGGVLMVAARSKKRLRIISGLVFSGSLLLAVFVYFCIPSTPRTPEELCGNYILDCDLVHDELALNLDGSFEQTVSVKATGETVSSKGTWSYHTQRRGGLISGDVTFHSGFVSVLEWPDKLRPDYAHLKPGAAIFPAEYYFGQFELGGRVDSWPQWKKVD